MSRDKVRERIFLSPPHMGGDELELIKEAFASNYIAPVGPQLAAFEEEFAELVGARYAAAVVSGTAGLHLLMRYVGVGRGDVVLCSTLTFAASTSPIVYEGGTPVFIDSDYTSWNMDSRLLAQELERRAGEGALPKAVLLVHLYGQSADIAPVLEVCERYGVALVEDAAEALGAEYRGKAPGTFGKAGVYSFNGNKIITTSGGGMVVSDDLELIRKVRFWATQARDPAPHYEHSELGYNYRMSNLLAAVGRGQLRVLSARVERKREIFSYYFQALKDLPGISFMPEADFGRATRWLSCVLIDPDLAGTTRDDVMAALEQENIESRPTWKPMHLQPLYSDCAVVGGGVAEHIFRTGLCLPSGTAMTEKDLDRIVATIRRCWS